MKKILLFILSAFPFQNMNAQIADFENWHNYNVSGVNLKTANGWSGLDSTVVFYGMFFNPGGTFVSQVEKETPGNGSATGLKVITKNQSEITGIIAAGPFPSVATNGQIEVNTGAGTFDILDGWPYNNNPFSVSMWIKNNVVGGDSTGITVLAIDNSDGDDSIAAVADTVLGTNISTWTKITLPFKYNPAGFSTTLIRVAINSSANYGMDTLTSSFTGLHDGTWLAVDDLEITAPSGISQYLYSSKIANIYPTQIHDRLNVNLQQKDNGNYRLQIFDLKGSTIQSYTITELINSFDLSSLLSGQYLYGLKKDNKIIQTGKIEKL